jgi:hypothetical protein
MRTISLCSLLFLSSSVNFVRSDCHHAPTATINAGTIIGKTTSLPAALGPVNQFLGVPFAKSPPERFSPAQPASRFVEPFNATEFKPACIQQFRCRCHTKRAKCIPYQHQQIHKQPRISINTSSTTLPRLSQRTVCTSMFSLRQSQLLVLVNLSYSGSLVVHYNSGMRVYSPTSCVSEGEVLTGLGQATYDGSSFAAHEDVVVVTANYRTNGKSKVPNSVRDINMTKCLDSQAPLNSRSQSGIWASSTNASHWTGSSETSMHSAAGMKLLVQSICYRPKLASMRCPTRGISALTLEIADTSPPPLKNKC